MPLLTQTVDALWHTLCPSFKTSVLRISRLKPSKSRPIRSRSSNRWLYPARVAPLAAPLLATARLNFWSPRVFSPPTATFTTASSFRKQKNSKRYLTTTAPRASSQQALEANSGPYESVPAEKIAARYADLKRASERAQYQLTHNIVRQLVYDYGESPNLRLYEALILCNASAYHGSVYEVDLLLEEMDHEGIPPDSALFHAILKVLAIHPDYLTRTAALAALEKRWFPLTDDGWHYAGAGLVRDRQLERAIAHVERMEELKINVQPWFYDLLTYLLASNAFFAEALALTQRRVLADDNAISGPLWEHLLETASRAFHHSTVLYVWQRCVVQHYINPSLGMCINVLDTAARAGDPRLAEDVMQTLRQRRIPLQIFHYEALLDAYVNANRIAPALAILAAMDRDGLAPSEASARSLYLRLRQSPERTTEAATLLAQPIRGIPAGQLIPPCALNAIIDAFVHQGRLDAAFELYWAWPTLPVLPPVTATFNALIRGCTKLARKDLAMVAATEMLKRNVPPDALTYDRLILTCLNASMVDTSHPAPAKDEVSTLTTGSTNPSFNINSTATITSPSRQTSLPSIFSPFAYPRSSTSSPSTSNMYLEIDDAWRYYDEMRGRGWWLRRGTLLKFVRRCIEVGDERVWSLVDEAAAHGAPVPRARAWVAHFWGKAAAKEL